MITAELMASFAYSQAKQEKHIKAMTAHITDQATREETAQKIRELEEDFDTWFIKRERDQVADLCEGIARHLRRANTIWPDYMVEFTERRLEMDRAMECCNALQDELQYIAEALPADKNKYMAIVLEVETEFNWIKSLRQSDNRFLKHLTGSNFKQATQLFEMNHLLETAHLQRDLREGKYGPELGQKCVINERGKTRYITSNVMRDKTVNHVLCDEVLSPAIAPFVIYDNDASQKGKGVKHHRDRIEVQLHDYYQRHGNNQGWILLVDFSGYYPNITHDKCLEVMDGFLDRSGLQPEEHHQGAQEAQGLQAAAGCWPG